MKTNTRNISIWLFVILSFISCGQNNNHQQEQAFVQELNKMLAWTEGGMYSDEVLDSIFDFIIRNPQSLEYEFTEEIPRVEIATSDDGNMRAYSLERCGFEGNPSLGFSCRTLLQYRSRGSVFYQEVKNFNGFITHIHHIDSNKFYLLQDWQGCMHQGTYEHNILYVYKIDNNTLHKVQGAFVNKKNVSNQLEFSWDDFGEYVEIDYDKEDSLVVYSIAKRVLYVIKGAPLMNKALKYRQYHWNGRCFEPVKYDEPAEYYNDRFFIRIEQNSENSWTYKCWNGGVKSGKPSLVITSGTKQYWTYSNDYISYDEWVTDDESSPSGEKYIFSNNGYRYEYRHGWLQDEPIDELYVFDPDENIIYYGRFTPVQHL
ncbi:MAG: hypothetical protein IKA49_02635 [Alistipes sp.]|nr:hypothetical protein [Alistipes sp.]